MFKRLVFSKLRENLVQEECVGVIGYAFLMKTNRKGISYVPSTFIRAFSVKAGLDIVEFLIQEGCIVKIDRNEEIFHIPEDSGEDIRVTEYFPEDDFYVKITRGNKASSDNDTWKHPAYLYYIKDKLRLREEYYVCTEEVKETIISNIHLLNNLSFNHYKHCFLPLGGKLLYNYNIRKIFNDSRVDGRHYNIFTRDPEKIEWVFEKPVFVSIKDFLPLILADQLKKAFNSDELYRFFLKPRYIKKDKRPTSYTEFDDVVSPSYFEAVIYGFDIIDEFRRPFPGAFDILYLIKNGSSDLRKIPDVNRSSPHWLNRYYERWQEGLFIRLQKSNWRISKDVPERAILVHQPYYKIISYVLHTKQMMILNAVWNWLKKYKIPFIAFYDGVYVEGEQRGWVENVFTIIGEKFLDPKLRIYAESYTFNEHPLIPGYFPPFDEMKNELEKSTIRFEETSKLFKDLFDDGWFKKGISENN